uniref:Uncharacterized protein n=1 Tax=Brassica oleracea TaxID=3712 RepID=A0A3P6GGF1_BRAOL|nr:unnamed protein product [Brassica oleracea]
MLSPLISSPEKLAGSTQRLRHFLRLFDSILLGRHKHGVLVVSGWAWRRVLCRR